MCLRISQSEPISIEFSGSVFCVFNVSSTWRKLYLGALQRDFFLQKSEITMEVGGWIQVSLRIFLGGKSSQNIPKPVLIILSGIPCVLLKVVGCCDLSVLSRSVMGFQKKKIGCF